MSKYTLVRSDLRPQLDCGVRCLLESRTDSEPLKLRIQHEDVLDLLIALDAAEFLHKDRPLD